MVSYRAFVGQDPSDLMPRDPNGPKPQDLSQSMMTAYVYGLILTSIMLLDREMGMQRHSPDN